MCFSIFPIVFTCSLFPSYVFPSLVTSFTYPDSLFLVDLYFIVDFVPRVTHEFVFSSFPGVCIDISCVENGLSTVLNQP